MIADDWARPTPAYRVLPAVLREVEAAGARCEDVRVMTASGVNAPLCEEDLIWKVDSATRQDVYDPAEKMTGP